MRSLLVVALLVVTPSIASAERSTTISLGGVIGGVQRSEGAYDDVYAPTMAPTGGPRLSLTWEQAPLAVPAQRGHAIGVDLVPELTAGALFDDERGEAYVGLGARGELKISQRDAGWLRLSARMALYVAARALVVGRAQDTLGEFAFGEYIYLGRSRMRFGGEMAVTVREAAPVTDERQVGVFASMYLGWAL